MKKTLQNSLKEKGVKVLRSKLSLLSQLNLYTNISKKFVIFILGLLFTMMQPMIKIAKKHPIAFWAAIILHAILLYGLIYSNIDRWEVTQNKPSVSQAAPIETVMIEYEIIEAEEERLQDLEQQKQQKIKEEEKRSESAQQSQKIAEQEALKAKAKKVMAEVQRKAEEAKAKEAEALAEEAAKQKEEAEVKRKAEEALKLKKKQK